MGLATREALSVVIDRSPLVAVQMTGGGLVLVTCCFPQYLVALTFSYNLRNMGGGQHACTHGQAILSPLGFYAQWIPLPLEKLYLLISISRRIYLSCSRFEGQDVAVFYMYIRDRSSS